LVQCVDLQGPIRHGLAKTLLGYLSDDKQKAWLADLLSPSQRAKFKNVLEEERRGVADLLLNELSSAKPPLLDLLHLLPVIQPRFYTISSSAALSPRIVHITVGITEYTTKGRNAAFAGLTSALLSKSHPGSLRVFVRASTFRLPRSLSTPVIMVGPGTGIAPMRALALERGFQRQQSPAQPYGATVLFFGCKYAQMDFIYRDELEALAGEGVLTELHTAFSRDGDKKVYVQDLIASPSQADKLVQWIEQGAFIFVCGATAMGTDVMNAFVKIYAEKQGVSVEKAQAKVKEMQEQGRYVQELWTA
jgi:NADPH-ferrihemoprotein reductase